MEPREYVDARWSALVRAAVLLGASEAEAPDLVRRVLADNQRRIRRAKDPDPLVHRALAAAIPRSEQTRFGAEQDLETRREMLIDAGGRPVPAPVAAPLRPRRRRWPLVAAATVLVAAGVAAAVTTRSTYDPPGDTLRADQVPSLFGYDVAAAQSMLSRRGFDVTLKPGRACQVQDRVVATDPPTGTTYEPGDPITVYASVPADISCLTDYQDVAAAWQFLDFANDRGSAPAFADRVVVYYSDGPGTVILHAEDADRWEGTGVLSAVRRATDRVALVDDDPVTYAVPTLSVRDATETTTGCGVPDAAGPGQALSVIIGAPADRTSCPVRIDLFRSRGLIDAVVLYPALS
jgi:PASTA domain-containing protein